jgi:hypothetical protein
MLVLASALLAAVVATALLTIPTLAQIEEPWNIVVLSQGLTIARITFIAALAHALILGLPLYLLLRSLHRLGIVSCALAGFVIGAAPFGILDLISMVGVQNASTAAKPTVVNGVPTLAGWVEYAYAVGFMGLLGLAGGVTFWAAMRLSGQIAGKANKTEAPSSNRHAGSWGIACAAALLAAAIVVMPSVVKDNSCHNLFREGRTSVGPQIYAEIKLSGQDWPTLRQLFIDFGAVHSLSFRSDEQIRRGNLMWRSLSLCNEAGININAIDRPWLALLNAPLAGRGMNLSVYGLKPGSDWNPLARDLLDRIDRAWPQNATFRGPDGRVISIEKALKGRQ